jgi:hypothetical protein
VTCELSRPQERLASPACHAEQAESPGVAIGADPATANSYYLYATFGKDTAALGSYEYLPIVGSDSGQTFGGNGWKLGAQTAAARYQHGIYAVSQAEAPRVASGTTYIYAGGGTVSGSSTLQALDVAKIGAGGDLGVFAPTTKTVKHFGFGAAAAVNYLFAFGGETASLGFDFGEISASPPGRQLFQRWRLRDGGPLPTGRRRGARAHLLGRGRARRPDQRDELRDVDHVLILEINIPPTW